MIEKPLTGTASAARALPLACAGLAISFALGLPAFAQPAAEKAGAEKAAPAKPAAERGEPGEPEPDRPVTLQEAIHVAHQNHARIAVAEEQVEQARERVRQAKTGTLPSVTGSVGYSLRGQSSLGGLFGGEPTQTIPGSGSTPPRKVAINTDTSSSDRGLQPKVAINYNVWDGGLTRANVRQARIGVEGSLAALGTTRNDQAFTVTQNYLAQLRAERVLELRVVQEDLASEQLKRVDARIAAGAAAAADRALPLSELRNRQVDRILAENDVRVAANTLRNSMGLPPGRGLRLVQQQENRDEPLALGTLQDLAMRQRPEVVQAETQVRSAEASVSIARIGRKPRLDTQFAFNITPNNEFSRSDYSFGAAISLPLWDAGLTHSREMVAKSEVQAAAATLAQTRKDVSAEVVEARLNLVNARERLDAARLAVDAAQVNLESTTARYERGVAGTTVVDLIQAQVQYATASNSAIQALYDTFLAQAQLNRAVGR